MLSLFGGIGPWEIALLFFLIIPLGVATWLWRQCGKRGRIIMASLFLILVLTGAIVLPALSRVVSVRANSPAHQADPIMINPPAEAINTTWDINDSELPFQAENYPSIRLAAQAMSKKALEVIPTMIGDINQLKAIHYYGIEEGLPILSEIDSAIRPQYPQVSININKATEGKESVIGNLNIIFTKTVVGSFGTSDYPSTVETMVQLQLRWGETIRDIETKVYDKPWADNFTAFVNANPKCQWLLAQSGRPASSETEAHQQALDDAVRKIGKLAGIDQLHIKLNQGEWLADRFVQKFNRPYGPVWREALLINASPKVMEVLKQKNLAQVAEVRKSWTYHLLSLGGILGVICILYLFLNAATRGYYVWSLRIATIVLGLIGLAMVLWHWKGIGT